MLAITILSLSLRRTGYSTSITIIKSREQQFVKVLEGNYVSEIGHSNRYIRLPFQRAIPAKRQYSAYILVYICQSRLDQILALVTKDDTPPHFRKFYLKVPSHYTNNFTEKRLDKEAALKEARQKEQKEAHL